MDGTEYHSENLLNDYKFYLKNGKQAENTIKSYCSSLDDYGHWYTTTYGQDINCSFLRINILDYISFKKNVQKIKASSINSKLSALSSFNKFLVNCSIQTEIIITTDDYFRVQAPYASPSTLSKQQVEEFRQKILVNEGKRNHAAVTIMAYAGLRVSEVTNLRLEDINIQTKELVVKSGKGNKQRLVYINDKIVHAVQEYLKIRPKSDSPYLFLSRQGGILDRTRFNQIFNKYSNNITPHILRHFYCSNAIENGFSIAEVANQAGHSSVQTTLRYTNPTREKMKEKANLL